MARRGKMGLQKEAAMPGKETLLWTNEPSLCCEP